MLKGLRAGRESHRARGFWTRMAGPSREASRSHSLSPARPSEQAKALMSRVSQLPARLDRGGAAEMSALPLDAETRVQVARGMNRGAGVLAGSVLFDSAIEHYRG